MIPIIIELLLINVLPVLSYTIINLPRFKSVVKNRDILYFLLLVLPVFLLYYLIETKLLILVVVVVILSWIAVIDYYFTNLEKFTTEMTKSVNLLNEQLKTINEKYNEVITQHKNITGELNKYVNLFNLVQEINQHVELQKIGNEFYKKLSFYFADKINFAGIIIAKKKDIITILPFSPYDDSVINKINTFWKQQTYYEAQDKILEYKIYENQYQYILTILHKLNQEEISHLDFFVEETKIGFIRSILFKEAEELARKDGLTGLYLRRYFLSRLNDELIRAARYNDRFSVIMFDIDFFKKVNDTYGHITGDFILKEIARIISDTVAEQGLCSRWGGEEFLVFIPYQSKKEVYALAENIRKTIEQYNFYFNDQNIKITISGGISSYPEDATGIERLIELADQKLYKAKQSGRNRIEI